MSFGSSKYIEPADLDKLQPAEMAPASADADSEADADGADGGGDGAKMRKDSVMVAKDRASANEEREGKKGLGGKPILGDNKKAAGGGCCTLQ